MPTTKIPQDETKTASVASSRRDRDRQRYAQNRERRLGQMRQWRANNLELIRKYRKKQYANDAENAREASRSYYARNQDRCKDAARQRYYKDLSKSREAGRRHSRQWRADNPVKAREWDRLWRDRNPGRIHDNRRRHYNENKIAYIRRANKRRALLSGSYTAADIDRLYETQLGTCPGCLSRLKGKYEIDHVMPLALDPTGDHLANLQLLCQLCNRRKRAMHPDDWAARIGKLFV